MYASPDPRHLLWENAQVFRLIKSLQSGKEWEKKYPEKVVTVPKFLKDQTTIDKSRTCFCV